jgi:hypothetical protein
MYPLTPTQQKALITFKKTGELGILSNLLIEHCLEELKNNEEARNKFNNIFFSCTKCEKHTVSIWEKENEYSYYNEIRFAEKYTDFIYGSNFDSLNDYKKINITQTLLSTTPDGAVMPFLDVPIKEIQKVVITTYHRGKLHVNYEYNIGRFATLDALTVCNVTPTTLRQQLSQKYHNLITEQSKTPYQALLEITKDYINHFYV